VTALSAAYFCRCSPKYA